MATSFSERWNPYTIYTIQEAELREWFNRNGSVAYYDGKRWKPESKRLVGLRNAILEVRFVEAS